MYPPGERIGTIKAEYGSRLSGKRCGKHRNGKKAAAPGGTKCRHVTNLQNQNNNQPSLVHASASQGISEPRGVTLSARCPGLGSDESVANYFGDRANPSQKALVSHAALAGGATVVRIDNAISADAMVFMSGTP